MQIIKWRFGKSSHWKEFSKSSVFSNLKICFCMDERANCIENATLFKKEIPTSVWKRLTKKYKNKCILAKRKHSSGLLLKRDSKIKKKDKRKRENDKSMHLTFLNLQSAAQIFLIWLFFSVYLKLNFRCSDFVGKMRRIQKHNSHDQYSQPEVEHVSLLSIQCATLNAQTPLHSFLTDPGPDSDSLRLKTVAAFSAKYCPSFATLTSSTICSNQRLSRKAHRATNMTVQTRPSSLVNVSNFHPCCVCNCPASKT